jgi:Flp pilus assembly protein TadG
MAGKSQCVSQERQRAFPKETKMNLFQRLKSTTSRFARSEGGQFAVLFAISASVLFAAIGLSVDVARLISAKSQLTNALDVAKCPRMRRRRA